MQPSGYSLDPGTASDIGTGSTDSGPVVAPVNPYDPLPFLSSLFPLNRILPPAPALNQVPLLLRLIRQ